MSDVVGSASFELRAVREKLKKDLADAERDLKGFTDKAERDIGGSGKRLGGGLSGIAAAATTGFAALAAVLAVVAAGAVRVGIESFRMAESISDTAKRVNVSTEALQEFREVARRSGEDVGAADQALESFNKTLGEAASGLSKEAVTAFAALRISPEQLRGFNDTEEALEVVIDRIGDLSSEADRAAIAEKLGLGPLATALREGSDEVARLRDEAREMGVILDDALIQKGAEAAQRMDDLSTVVGIQLAGAFLSLSDEVIAFTGYLARALEGLNDFLGKYDQAKTNFAASYGQESADAFFSGDIGGAGRGIIKNTFNGRAARVSTALRNPQAIDLDDPALMRQQMAVEAYNSRRARRDSDGPDRLIDTSSRPRTRAPRNTSARDAIRAAELEARRAERFQDDLDRARQRLLGLAEDEADTAQARFDAAQASIAAEREIRDANLDRQVIAGELNEARRAALDAANAEADAVEDRLTNDRAFREISEERLAEEALLADLAADLVSLQVAGARTAKERQRLELELLEITQRQRRTALSDQLEREGKSPEFRAAALGMFDRGTEARRAAVVRNNLSPLDRFRDQGLNDIDEINESYQQIAVDGLEALNDGITDAILNSKNLGDVFSSVAKQIIADLAAIAVRRAIIEPLADMLFGGGQAGGGSGGSGGFWSSILSFGTRALGGQGTGPASGDNGGLLPGRLLGAPVLPIAGPKGSDMFGASKAPNGFASQAPIVKLIMDEGGLFKPRVEQISGPIAVETGQVAARAGSGMAQTEMAKRSRYRTR